MHAGRVELEYGEQTIVLDTGDSAYFNATVSHKLRAVGGAPVEVVVVTRDESRR